MNLPGWDLASLVLDSTNCFYSCMRRVFMWCWNSHLILPVACLFQSTSGGHFHQPDDHEPAGGDGSEEVRRQTGRVGQCCPGKCPLSMQNF